MIRHGLPSCHESGRPHPLPRWVPFRNARRKPARGVVAVMMAVTLAAIGCRPASDGKPGAGPGPGVSGSQVIKIVSSLPRTGSARTQTDTVVNGIKMALEEAGYRVGAFTIEYQDWDDATAAKGSWAAEAEESNAKKAVSDPDVMVYLGPFNSGAAKVSMPILNKADLLMISPSNTWPGFTKKDVGEPNEPEIYRPTGRINYLRVVPTDDRQGEVAAAWAKEMGVKKVYLLDDSEVYGRGIAIMFKEACRDQGIQVLAHESIDPQAQEFRSLMAKIKAAGPELVYFGGTTQTKGGQIAKDMVAAGIAAKLMVPDGCYEQAFLEAAGSENLNGRCFLTFGGVPPEQLAGKGKEFVDQYTAKHGSLPEAYAVYAYDAAKAALKAIEKAGKKDRRAIADAALAIKDFDGALGTWSFDANGDTDLSTMSGIAVANGKFEFVKLLGKP